MATSTIKAIRAGFEATQTFSANDWVASTGGGYEVCYLHNDITPASHVEVNFADTSLDTTVFYIGYEKISGAIKFTTSVLPLSSITLVIRVINSEVGGLAITSASSVSTTAIPGVSNVNDALIALNNKIDNLFNVEFTTDGLQINTTNTNTITHGGYAMIGNLVIVNMRFTITSTGQATGTKTFITGLPTPSASLHATSSAGAVVALASNHPGLYIDSTTTGNPIKKMASAAAYSSVNVICSAAYLTDIDPS